MVEWKSCRLFSSPGGSNAGFPPSLSHHTSDSLILDTDLESQIVLCNVLIAADTGTGNWPHELLACRQAVLCLQRYLGEYICKAILQTASRGN